MGNSEFHTDSGKREYANGHAMVNPDLPGTMDVGFGPISPESTGSNYIILGTDNVNFSYVWSCSETCVFSKCLQRPVLWILNRVAHLQQAKINEQIENAMKILESSGYDTEKLRESMMVSEQQNCDYN